MQVGNFTFKKKKKNQFEKQDSDYIVVLLHFFDLQGSQTMILSIV